MVLICHGNPQYLFLSTLELLITPHGHATSPSNVPKCILGNHVFYDNEIGLCCLGFDGEDRQPNAEWAATLVAGMKANLLNHHPKRWAYST